MAFELTLPLDVPCGATRKSQGFSRKTISLLSGKTGGVYAANAFVKKPSSCQGTPTSLYTTFTASLHHFYSAFMTLYSVPVYTPRRQTWTEQTTSRDIVYSSMVCNDWKKGSCTEV